MLVPSGSSMLGNEQLRFPLDQIDLNLPAKVKSEQFIASMDGPDGAGSPGSDYCANFSN